ncbi:MAG TPA: acyl-CoA dehydrogenase family protein [Pseudomonadales bacterium]|nr:acyl-CoA dehydrogenase family protein [Pseudomonadales bacterium]
MDFKDSTEEAAFRAEVRAFLDQHARLRASSSESAYDGATTDAERVAIAKAWQKTLADNGWACISWPKAFGGRDATPIQNVIWNQEVSRYVTPDGMFIIGQGMCAPTMMAYATEAQNADHLPRIASGEEVWCQLFSEPVAGSDLAGIKTKAVKEGDEWVVNGQKVWTSGAHYSDWGILITRTDPSVAKHKGLTMFFLDMKTPGVEVKPIKQINGNRDFNEVYFTDVRIPDSQRLGSPGEGWRVALVTLMNERLAVGGGLSNSVMDVFKAAQQVDLDDEPAIENRAVRERLADWYCKEMGLKYTSYRMITALSKGQDPGPEASISKVVVAANNNESASFALDLQDYGGILDDEELSGFGNQFQRQFMRSPANRIEGGSDEILRNIISERVLGMPPDIRLDKDVPFSEVPSANSK